MAANWTWMDALGIGLRAARASAPDAPTDRGRPAGRTAYQVGGILAGRVARPRPTQPAPEERSPALVSNVPPGMAPLFMQGLPETPPLGLEEKWRLLNLDRRALDSMASNDLIELLCDLSPDISRALWDFLRMCNPGWEAVACRPGTDKKLAVADAKLQEFLQELKERHGSVDLIINRLFVSAFLRGAFLAELVLDRRGRKPLDIATPDPASIRFRRMHDDELGIVWEMGQFQDRDFVPINRPTVRYLPVDPLPGRPFGRPLATPALFSTLFLLNLLHDIKRVVSQQGYPRIDIEVDLEALRTSFAANLEDDPAAFEEWVQGAIAQVEAVYTNLEPDDAYVHSSAIKINRPVGTVDANSLSAVQGLITALERMAVRALKTMPLMMGITDGVSEANANRQWEIYSAGIKALQHLGESLLEYLLTKAMQAQGVACTVQFRFAELRAAEMLRDEQTRQLKILNVGTEYDRGWISQNEAAQKVVGHAPDAEEPRAQTMAKEASQAAAQAAQAATAASAEQAAQKLALDQAKLALDAKKAEADHALKAAQAAAKNPEGATGGGGESATADDPANNQADVPVSV